MRPLGDVQSRPPDLINNSSPIQAGAAGPAVELNPAGQVQATAGRASNRGDHWQRSFEEAEVRVKCAARSSFVLAVIWIS